MAFPLPQAAPARRVRLPGARRRRERAYRRGRRERCPDRPGRGALAAAGGQAGRRIAARPAPHRGDHRARGRPRSGAGEAARQHRLRALLSQEDDAGVRGPRAALAGRARRRRGFDGVRVTALGDRIRALRNERELQQRHLAEKAELTPSMVSQIESGRLTPSLNTLRKLADALGVTIAALFDGQPSGSVLVSRSKDYPVVSFDGSSERWAVLGYELQLNSYDLGLDIELYDAVRRLRCEHPEIGAVVLTSGKERVFCAGANIRMLGQSSHGFKVNFCKFTNETRNAIEEASGESKQAWLCVVNGPCAGGGYELAMACQHILMADDGNTSVALPEVPLLAVLPGTGGLTRLVDKRRVRRDRADVFCTLEEGIKGQRAVDWGFVDEVAPRSKLSETARRRALELAARTDRPKDARGIVLTPLERTIEGDRIGYRFVTCAIDRARGRAEITVHGPDTAPPGDVAGIHAVGVGFWPLAVARELDDLILHLRANEASIGLWVLRTAGDAERVEAHDRMLADHAGHWLVREIRLYLRRTLKRLDVTSRSIFALVEPGSCFAGTLLELALAADRAYMLDGPRERDDRPPATVRLGEVNFGLYPMPNGLSRLQSRFLGEPGRVDELRGRLGHDLDAGAALKAG